MTTPQTETNRTNTLVISFIALALTSVMALGCNEEEAEPETEEPLILTCGAEALFSFDHIDCGAMDAEGDNACWCILGYAWTGEGCEMLTGCECSGEDCDSLTETEDECLAAHDACIDETPIYTCGSAALHSEDHGSCDAMEAAGEGLCNCALGFIWNGSDCEMIAGCECVGADCAQLSQTQDECLAAHADCETESAVFSCGSAELNAFEHDSCAAMDATVQGECYCALGFAWNGSECEMLAGCECVGQDCDSLSLSLDECEAAHGGC